MSEGASLGYERTITILFIVAAIIALLKVGELASFVTQLGIAALIVSLLFIAVGPSLGSHAQWILIGVGVLAFYFGNYVSSALNFKIQALDISADIDAQYPSLALLVILVIAGLFIGFAQSKDLHQ